jgi:bloom syndrome protein
MTRHNLASHISWLLSNEVAPPAGVHARALPPSTTVGEILGPGLAEEDTEPQVPRSSPPNRRIPQTANVGQDFLRPAAPPPTPPKLHAREHTTGAAQEPMGKLASASRSTRPALVSQHQLATPASTTASSSLTQGYATFLRTNNGESKIIELLLYASG